MSETKCQAEVALVRVMMGSVVKLDATRRRLVMDDTLNLIVSEIEAAFIRQAADIRGGLINPFGF